MRRSQCEPIPRMQTIAAIAVRLRGYGTGAGDKGPCYCWLDNLLTRQGCCHTYSTLRESRWHRDSMLRFVSGSGTP